MSGPDTLRKALFKVSNVPLEDIDPALRGYAVHDLLLQAADIEGNLLMRAGAREAATRISAMLFPHQSAKAWENPMRTPLFATDPAEYDWWVAMSPNRIIVAALNDELQAETNVQLTSYDRRSKTVTATVAGIEPVEVILISSDEVFCLHLMRRGEPLFVRLCDDLSLVREQAEGVYGVSTFEDYTVYASLEGTFKANIATGEILVRVDLRVSHAAYIVLGRGGFNLYSNRERYSFKYSTAALTRREDTQFHVEGAFVAFGKLVMNYRSSLETRHIAIIAMNNAAQHFVLETPATYFYMLSGETFALTHEVVSDVGDIYGGSILLMNGAMAYAAQGGGLLVMENNQFVLLEPRWTGAEVRRV